MSLCSRLGLWALLSRAGLGASAGVVADCRAEIDLKRGLKWWEHPREPEGPAYLGSWFHANCADRTEFKVPESQRTTRNVWLHVSPSNGSVRVIEPLKGNDDDVSSDALLHIEDFTAADAGVYLCAVFDKASKDNELEKAVSLQRIRLRGKGRGMRLADGFDCPARQTLRQGRDERITCSPACQPGTPKLRATWYHNGVALDTGNDSQGRRLSLEGLRVPNFDAALHGGTYRVIFLDPATGANHFFRVEVLAYQRPRVLSLAQTPSLAKEGGPLRLTCEASVQGVAEPRVHWFIGSNSSDLDGSFLQIPKLKGENAGEYSCKVFGARATSDDEFGRLEASAKRTLVVYRRHQEETWLPI